MILPILTYNGNSWDMSKTQWNKIDAFYQKQLGLMLNIYHPRHISNTRLYSTIQSIPLRKTMEKRREKFLALVFQQDDEAPSKSCLKFCLQQLDEETKNKKTFRGRPRDTLLTTLLSSSSLLSSL